MDGQNTDKSNQSKLSRLQHELQPGLLATTSWLGKRGYYRQLLDQYVSSGWLESPARGVYRRPGLPLKWQHVVASLGTVLDRPPHVGGLSALELRGYAHFLKPRGPGEIHLYSDVKLPSWVTKLPVPERFVEHGNRLFSGARGIAGPLGTDKSGATHSTDALSQTLTKELWGPWDWDLVYSTPERAILELLDDVPQRESVEHVALLMGGLADLSSRRVLALLAACRSVKVKRLFLALASRHRHQWVRRVVEAADRGEVDLGTGKRSLVPGGKLHPKYLITLPEESDVRG